MLVVGLVTDFCASKFPVFLTSKVAFEFCFEGSVLLPELGLVVFVLLLSLVSVLGAVLVFVVVLADLVSVVVLLFAAGFVSAGFGVVGLVVQ